MALIQIDLCDFDAYRDAGRMVTECHDFADHLMVAEFLPFNKRVAYINVRTLEQVVYCVELSHCGYRIVSYNFDDVAEDVAATIYPSAHKLFAGISPLYAEEFGFGVVPLKRK